MESLNVMLAAMSLRMDKESGSRTGWQPASRSMLHVYIPPEKLEKLEKFLRSVRHLRTPLRRSWRNWRSFSGGQASRVSPLP